MSWQYSRKYIVYICVDALFNKITFNTQGFIDSENEYVWELEFTMGYHVINMLSMIDMIIVNLSYMYVKWI